jgi:hypothetical protein
MKRSTLFVAALAGLAAAGCQIEPGAPPTIGQGRYILTGRVVADSTATINLQNVTVQAQPVGGGSPFRTMVTNSAGVFRTAGMAAGGGGVVVVMGDSSIISATGRTEVFVGAADSTIAPTIRYRPGRVISGSLTYAVQDMLTARSIAFRNVKVWLMNSTRTTVLDSQRTSATGGIRFPVRPSPSAFYIRVDTASAEFRAVSVPAVIPQASRVDTVRVSAGFSANVTSSASASITYRAPYQIRARIFKDRNGDGIYRALATDPDTVVSGVRVWLRRAGGTANLGTGTVTSSTSTAATGNISFTGLDGTGVDAWALHVIAWYLPTGCTIASTVVVAGTTDVLVTGDLAGGPVPTKGIPLSCP